MNDYNMDNIKADLRCAVSSAKHPVTSHRQFTHWNMKNGLPYVAGHIFMEIMKPEKS